MNTLRNTFLVLFVCATLLLGIFATIQLVSGQRIAMSWFGLLLSSSTPLAFIGIRYFLASHGRDLHPILFSCMTGLGVAISMMASWKHGDSAGQVHVWSGLCLIAWVVYLRWFGIARPPKQSPGRLNQ